MDDEDEHFADYAYPTVTVIGKDGKERKVHAELEDHDFSFSRREPDRPRRLVPVNSHLYVGTIDGKWYEK